MMSKSIRALILLLLIAALIYAGFEIGRRSGKSDVQSQIIENYSFVRDIAELAALEANGVATFKSTNVLNDGSMSDALRKLFTEQTVHLSIPYTAKYGVDMSDSTMRIQRGDSNTVIISLPAPKLLSYELHLDRMDASSREGLLYSARPEAFMRYQQQLYSEGRAQLERNGVYRTQTAQKLERLLEKYFAAAGLRARCVFALPGAVVVPKQ